MMQRVRMFLATLAVLVLGSSAFAQKVAVPEHVPADVEAFVSITDANAMWNAFSSTPLHAQLLALWQLPDVQQDPDIQEFQLLLDKAAVELGFGLSPAELLGQHLKGADLYITQPPGASQPSLLIVSRFADAAKANAVADFIEGEIRKQSEDRSLAGLEPLVISRAEVGGGIEVVGVESENLFFASKGDLLFLSSSSAVLADSAISPGEARLLENTAIVENFGELTQPDGHLAYYFSGPLLSAVAKATGTPALEGDKLPRSTAGTMTFRPDRIETAAYVAGTPLSGALLQLASVPPGDLAGLLRFAQPDALMSFAVNTLDGPAMLEAITEQAKSNPDMAWQLEESLNQIRTVCAENNLSFDTDVLGGFGPEAAFFFNAFDLSNLASPRIDMVAAVKIRDREKADKVLATLERKVLEYLATQAQSMGGAPAPTEPTVEPYANGVIRSIAYNHPLFTFPVGMTTATTQDGYLLLSISPAPVRDALDRAVSGGGVQKSADWQRVAPAMLPAYNQYMQVSVARIGSSLQMFLPMLMARFQGSGQDMAAVNQLVALVQSMGTLHVTSSTTPSGNRISAVVLMP